MSEKEVEAEPASLVFSQAADGTLEISEPDSEEAWYFSPDDALSIGMWLVRKFGSKGEN